MTGTTSPHAARTDDEHLDRVFAALSDRTRRSILSRLAHGSATITELAAPYDMSLPAVSKHLTVLERAGLVRRERQGRSRRCRIRAQPLEEAEAWIESCRAYWTDTLDSLEDYLDRKEDGDR